MNAPPTRRSRPRANETGQTKKVPTAVVTPMVPPTPTDGVDLAGILSGVLVVVVRLDNDHYRRRVFLSLSAAERAVRRAHDRGHDAELVMCSLTPASTIRVVAS